MIYTTIHINEAILLVLVHDLLKYRSQMSHNKIFFPDFSLTFPIFNTFDVTLIANAHTKTKQIASFICMNVVCSNC